MRLRGVGLKSFYSEIGSRSLASATVNDALTHSRGKMEMWANYMASKYMYFKNASLGIESFSWNVQRFPIQNIDPSTYFLLFGRELKPFVPSFTLP